LINARDKVAFITAASQGLETLEGPWSEDPTVKMGRFTQVLIQALDGASSRRLDDTWGVHADGIAADLKSLYRLRGWTDLFEPSPAVNQNERYSIIAHPQPKVPVIIMTRPADRILDCSMEIFLPADRSKAAIERCEAGPRTLWEVWLAASDWTHLLVANHASGVKGELAFTPSEPIFGRSVAFT
jgi:hypothetical protein